ncbi:MAG: HK97 gp10 family phage protein [Candidatus Gastranaerophilaceae bacterium]
MAEFDIDELLDFYKKVTETAELFPERVKKALKTAAKSTLKTVKQTAAAKVKSGGDRVKTKNNGKKVKLNYHARFKVGRVFKNGSNDTCIRVYNSAPHGHLIENGHVVRSHGVSKGKTRAFKVLDQNKNLFERNAADEIEKLIEDLY